MIWERWKQLDFLRVSFFKLKLLQELVGIAYCRKHLCAFGQRAQKDVAAKEPRGTSKKETHEACNWPHPRRSPRGQIP